MYVLKVKKYRNETNLPFPSLTSHNYNNQLVTKEFVVVLSYLRKGIMEFILEKCKMRSQNKVR